MTDVFALARQLGAEDRERLLGWIAWRVGRSQPLARDLEHALIYWLDDDQRARLGRWMAARLAAGKSPVPGASPCPTA